MAVHPDQLVKINLPPYVIGCDAEPARSSLRLPALPARQDREHRVRRTGGRAYELVRNFVWTNDHQNAVATDIGNGGMSADQAAAEVGRGQHRRLEGLDPRLT